jgi:outer membrane protein assembly factor BamB
MLEPIWSLDLVDLNMTQCHHSSPTVADLDNDGRKEILLAYRRSFGSCYASGPGENRLLCADDEGQVKWIFPPLDRPEMAGHPMTSTTLSDLDGDGYLEILIGRRGSSDESCAAVHCLNHDGNEIWNYTMEGMLGAVTADPQVYDQDGDGRPEIYVASGYSPYGFDRQQGRMTVLDPEGDEIWVKEVDGYAEWPPLVWDIDKDGQGEIVICLNSNVVLCLDAGDGREEWRYKMEGEEPIMVTPVAADVDNDGRYEIIFTGPDGDLYVLSDRGKKEWRFRKPTEGTVRFGIPIGDIDGDSHMETCFMDDELLYCIDLYDRSIEWTFKPETPNHYSNYNTFADVTGDGEIDVLVVAPCLYVLSNRGIHLASFDTPKLIRDDRALSGMWSGDLDDDGLVEILVKFEGDGLYCLATGSTYKAENMIWPKCLHNNENRPVVPMEDGKYQGAQ